MDKGERGSCHHLLLISEDVLIEILLWLPVISLLRFKSVCKSWRSIIQSPFFIHLHTNTTTKLGGSGSGSGSVLMNLQVVEKKGNNILTLSGEEFEFFEYLGIPATLLEYLLDEEKEFKTFTFVSLEECVDFRAVGCCDGIICLHDLVTRNVVLWNPAIKQSRILPKPSNLLGFSRSFSTGVTLTNDTGDDYRSEDFVRFGIDVKNNDHKVLLITTYKKCVYEIDDAPAPPHERRVHVYSLSTDSWKSIDNATLSAPHPDTDLYIKTNYNQGIYLNGSYFFTAIYLNEDMFLLLSFDFTEEIFRTIHPPLDLTNNDNFGYVYFISFGEKLALIDVKFGLSDRYYEYDFWVLNEHHSGMKEESWTKFYTIGPPSVLENEPQFITNNGEFAIMFGRYRQDESRQGALWLLNLITGEKKVLRCGYEDVYCDFVQVYKPSLMPIDGNGATPT